MRKTLLLFAGIALFVTGLPGLADASRPKRKPWLMIGKAETVETQKPAPAKAVHRSRPPKDQPSIRTVSRSRAQPESARRVLAQAPDKGKIIARQALAYKGTKYKFGGTSQKGLDCSGLVARVYSDLKIGSVPRVSASLYKAGEPVSSSELRPGDLVFFRNTYKRGISHVGVYAGKNKFVHASNKRRGVIVTSMADPYYQLRYAGARRLY